VSAAFAVGRVAVGVLAGPAAVGERATAGRALSDAAHVGAGGAGRTHRAALAAGVCAAVGVVVQRVDALGSARHRADRALDRAAVVLADLADGGAVGPAVAAEIGGAVLRVARGVDALAGTDRLAGRAGDAAGPVAAHRPGRAGRRAALAAAS